jgi:parallel beta-helix repeat protein
MVGAMVFAAGATADTINVRPGKNAIQRAIARADAGDRLRIHDGRYRGAVELTKRLRLVGVGKRPVIDARCKSEIAIDVNASGVVLDHLKVIGAADLFAVNFMDVRRGTARDLVLAETCNGEDATLYGINVYDSQRIEVLRNRAFGGFRDAGIYVGDITDTSPGPLLVVGNEAYGNNRGIIVEDSSGVDVRVRDNRFHDNTVSGVDHPSGIVVRRSDGILFRDNRLRDNGDYGFHIDAGSDGNVLLDNVASGSGISDLFNQGSGNCGSRNSFGSTSGNPLVVPCG